MSETYTVEFHDQGNVQTVEVPEDKQILQAALDAGIKLWKAKLIKLRVWD